VVPVPGPSGGGELLLARPCDARRAESSAAHAMHDGGHHRWTELGKMRPPGSEEEEGGHRDSALVQHRLGSSS
jgi:hypothetical protein